jgi:hypothetical protein
MSTHARWLAGRHKARIDDTARADGYDHGDIAPVRGASAVDVLRLVRHAHLDEPVARPETMSAKGSPSLERFSKIHIELRPVFLRGTLRPVNYLNASQGPWNGVLDAWLARPDMGRAWGEYPYARPPTARSFSPHWTAAIDSAPPPFGEQRSKNLG